MGKCGEGKENGQGRHTLTRVKVICKRNRTGVGENKGRVNTVGRTKKLKKTGQYVIETCKGRDFVVYLVGRLE